MKTRLDQCLDKVETAYPGLRATAKLVIIAAAATRLKRQHPLSLILVGQASSGKTSLLMPLIRAKSGSRLRASVLRVDEFTPASMVTHASQKSEAAMKKIDLLPKMSGKCVVTKEMAPLFSGHEDEVIRRFAVLASVLDGEGYVSSSGNHGMRGYDEPIVFSLIGAVTPRVLSPKVLEAMNSVGPRICFWTMPERNPGFEWVGPGIEREMLVEEAEREVQNYFELLFSMHSAGSVPMDRFEVPREISKLMPRIAVLMANARATVRKARTEFDESETFEIYKEAPERGYSYLRQIACSSALIENRGQLEKRDLLAPLRVAISSGLPERAAILRLLFNTAHPMSNQDFQVRLGATDDTIRKRLGLLIRLSLVEQVSADRVYLYDLVEPLREVRKALSVYGEI